MQHEFKVYGRAGEPCDRCGTPIEKIRAGGRGTSYCPGCQRLDADTAAARTRKATRARRA
jgi:formamidopyrimidine-DNA glycosylase